MVMDDLQQLIALCEIKRHQLEKIIADTKLLFKPCPWPKKNGGVKKQVKRDTTATESGPTAGERKQMAEVDKLLNRAAKARDFVRQKEEIEERYNLEQAQRQQQRQRSQDEQTSFDPAPSASTIGSISQKPGGGPKPSNGLAASSRGRDVKSNGREGERGSRLANSSSRGVKGGGTKAAAVISQSSLSRVLSAADDKEKKQSGNGRTVTSRPVLSKPRGSVSSASGRYKPAHVTAPFKTQPDVKRRPAVGSRVRPGIPEVKNPSRDRNRKQHVMSARPENCHDYRGDREKQEREALYEGGKSLARGASSAKSDSTVGLESGPTSQDYTASFCRSSENADAEYGESDSGFRSKSTLSCEDGDGRGLSDIRRPSHDSSSEARQEEVVEDEEEEEEQAFCLEKHGHALPIPENLRRCYRKWFKFRHQVEAARRKRETKSDSVTSGFMSAMGREIDADVQSDPDLQELASLLALTQTYSHHVSTLRRLRDEFNNAGGELENVERVAGWHCIIASLLEDFASCAQDVRQATAVHNPDSSVAELSERFRALLGPDNFTPVSWLWNHNASSLLASCDLASANGDAVQVLRYKTCQEMSHLYSVLHDAQLAVMQKSLLHSWSSELLPQLDVQNTDPSVFRGLYGLLLDNGNYTSLPSVIYAPTEQAPEGEEEEDFSLS